MKRSIAVDVISILLIILFAYTASGKLFSIQKFKDVLWQSPLIGPGADVVAWAVPLSELAIVLLLFFSETRLIGLYASLSLLSLFTIYIGYMLLFSPQLPCSCGGVISSMSWQQHLLLNVGFIGLSVWGIVRERRLKG